MPLKRPGNTYVMTAPSVDGPERSKEGKCDNQSQEEGRNALNNFSLGFNNILIIPVGSPMLEETPLESYHSSS